MTKTPNPQPAKDRPHAKRFTEPSKTKGYLAKDYDVNNIMAKAQRGFTVPGMRKPPLFTEGMQLDLPQDFQSAMEIVQRSEQAFSELPAVLRDRFHNNPAELLTFLADVNNRPEAVRLGLIEDKKTEVLPPAEKPAVSDSKAANGGVDNAPKP